MAQANDLLYAERQGIGGTITAQEIADLYTPYVNTQTDESSFGTNRTFYNQFESGVNWIIKKSFMDANGNVTNTKATGVDDAGTAWTNRLTLTYS